MRILLVEDKAEVAECVVLALEALGHMAVHASSIAQAMELLDGPFDAAILDVDIGSETTAGVACMLRERRIPYVVASGHAADEVPAGMKSRRHLRKPYLLSDLELALSACRADSCGSRKQ